MARYNPLAFPVALLATLLFAPSLAGGAVISVGSCNIYVNFSCEIPVSISNASDVFAFQFDATFAPRILLLSAISEGNFLSTAGSTIFSPGTIDNVAGIAAGTADALAGNVPGASGSGVLANLSFGTLRPGTSAVSLSNVILLDSTLTDIPFTTLIGTVTVNLAPEPPVSWIGCLGLTCMLLARTSRRTRQGG